LPLTWGDACRPKTVHQAPTVARGTQEHGRIAGIATAFFGRATHQFKHQLLLIVNIKTINYTLYI
jgi:hypothetical protein